MQEARVLVKHIVGRLLLDTAAAGCPFRLEAAGERGWIVEIAGVPRETLEEIERHRLELNVFHFVQDRETGTLRKYWLYDTDEPELHISEGGELRLTLNASVPYSNDKV